MTDFLVGATYTHYLSIDVGKGHGQAALQPTSALAPYGIRTFDLARTASPIVNPAAMVANCVHPAPIVLGPGGL